MSEQISSNKRIAKNTLMLYIRMLLSVVVSLYTSRVVLEVLGVEDYGIYGLVGGVVAMFSFLNSTMAGATSRFLTFEMGKGNFERLKQTFSSALIIHIGIALLVCILAETVGMWFLCNKLVIPAERMAAAHWVYQFSVISMIVNFTQVPYNAAIIAHEKMDVYAYVELLNVFLKLGIVYLLTIGNFDKLVLYAFLVLIVNATIALIYRWYCVKHYEEARFSATFNKDVAKEMISFSMYNLLGNMGSVVNTQGTAFVINMFFGVLYNAAASIATTISGVITGFASNIMTAFRPQITKSYALDDITQFQSLISWALKAILFVYAFIALPVSFAIKDILALWLVEVPVYADVFCRLLLVSIFFETSRYIIIMGIHATGVVKLVSFSTSIAFILNPFIIYCFYKLNFPPSYAYVSIIVINALLTLLDIFILKHNESRISIKEFLQSLIRVLFVVVLVAAILFAITTHTWIEGKFLNIILIAGISSVTMIPLGFYLIFNKEQRTKVLSIFVNKLKLRR